MQRVELRQLRASVHEHRRAGQHAQLADPVKRPQLHAGEAHEQVDQEKGHERNQAQRKKVERAFAVHARVDVGQALTKARLDPVAQHKARCQKRQDGTDRGCKRYDQQALPHPKDRATGQRDDGRAGDGQSRGGHVNQEIHHRHRERLIGVQVRKTGLAGLELLNAEETTHIESQQNTDGQGQEEQHQNLTNTHNKLQNGRHPL